MASSHDKPDKHSTTDRELTTKFTPAMRERIILLLKAGNYAAVAARGAGIHPNTLRNWLKRGESEQEGPFRDFFEAVRTAEANPEIRAVGMIQKQMSKNWRAALTYLERKFPKRWGSRRLQLTRTSLEKRNLPVALRLKHDAEFLGQIACILDRSGSIESVLGNGAGAAADERDSPSSHPQASGVSAA